MKRINKRLGTILLLTILLTACKSYYNDTIHWMDSIELGTSLEDVKKSQPDFVEIDWEKPDTVDTDNMGLRFRITKIKGNNDILAMDHYLLFNDNKFGGRKSTK